MSPKSNSALRITLRILLLTVLHAHNYVHFIWSLRASRLCGISSTCVAAHIHTLRISISGASRNLRNSLLVDGNRRQRKFIYRHLYLYCDSHSSHYMYKCIVMSDDWLHNKHIMMTVAADCRGLRQHRSYPINRRRKQTKSLSQSDSHNSNDCESVNNRCA